MTTRVPDPVEYLHHHVNVDGKGGVCVYAWHWAGNSWFEIATCLCSNDDVYDESVAERVVRASAMEFQSIKMRLYPHLDRHRLTASDLEVVVLTSMVF